MDLTARFGTIAIASKIPSLYQLGLTMAQLVKALYQVGYQVAQMARVIKIEITKEASTLKNRTYAGTLYIVCLRIGDREECENQYHRGIERLDNCKS